MWEENTTATPYFTQQTPATMWEDNVTATPYPILDRTAIHFGYFVTLGIIIMLGYICNFLSVLVFINSKALRQSTTGLYLMSLAVADILFLFGDMLRWLDTDEYIPGYNFLLLSNQSCQFVYSLRYSAKLTSAWITVVITTERFFIVAFPLKAGSVCTCRKAVIVIILTYTICFTAGCLACFTIGVINYNGKMMCGYHGYYKLYNWIVLRVGSLLLPGLVVLVLTIVICIKLLRARRLRNRKLSLVLSPKLGTTSQQHHSSGIETQLTTMLLSVAIAFVALRLPYTIMFYVNDLKYKTWDPLDPLDAHIIYVTYKVTDLLASTNYAVNFFLYCISGSIFRRQFLSMVGCGEEGGRGVGYSAHGQGSISNHTFHGVRTQNSRYGIITRTNSRTDFGNIAKV